MLRTYTDGVWRVHQPPSPYVLAMLGNAVDPDELAAAVHAAITAHHSLGPTIGQRAVLEALRGFPDQHLIDLAPHIHELARDHTPTPDTGVAQAGESQRGAGAGTRPPDSPEPKSGATGPQAAW